jgi:hypothetical protein
VQRGLIVAVPLQFENAIGLAERDPRRDRDSLLALGTFHQQLLADGDLHALGQRN